MQLFREVSQAINIYYVITRIRVANRIESDSIVLDLY